MSPLLPSQKCSHFGNQQGRESLQCIMKAGERERTGGDEGDLLHSRTVSIFRQLMILSFELQLHKHPVFTVQARIKWTFVFCRAESDAAACIWCYWTQPCAIIYYEFNHTGSKLSNSNYISCFYLLQQIIANLHGVCIILKYSLMEEVVRYKQ